LSYEQQLIAHYAQVRARLYPKPLPKPVVIPPPPPPPPVVQVKAQNVPTPKQSDKLKRMLKMVKVGPIFRRIIKETGVDGDEILGDTHRKPVVFARQRLMTELHEAGLSQSHVGRIIGRDHTTVCIGIRQYRKKVAQNA